MIGYNVCFAPASYTCRTGYMKGRPLHWRRVVDDVMFTAYAACTLVYTNNITSPLRLIGE